MPPSDLLLSSPPALSEQLRRRTNGIRSKIIKKTFNTQFARTASELSDFRHATAGLVDRMDDDVLSESFQTTVGFTTYDSYAPLLARFSAKPCKAHAIVDLFAPGLPDYLVESSSTSGGSQKIFPYYNRFSNIRSSERGSQETFDAPPKRTTAYLCYIGFDRLEVKDEDNRSKTTIYQTIGSVVTGRTQLALDPEEDGEKMGKFVHDSAAPFAALFIKKWQSFLLIQALFALSSESLESIVSVFINTLVDLMRQIDAEFDMLVECIANGTIPDLDGLATVRHHLEVNMSADPERAAELRRIGRPSSRPGWCGHVWPNLSSVGAISSGSFASSLPLARWFLGPSVDIRTHGYGSSECWVGVPYNPLELDYFKITDRAIVELLDINKSELIGALAQLWEVERGKRYEVVVTTRDGLWRYRLGDVVEISGFDPTDGVPVIQFVERRNVAMRFPNIMVSENQLKEAVSLAVLNTPAKVVNWTSAVDDRNPTATIAFFIELTGDYGFDLAAASSRILEELLRLNNAMALAFSRGEFGQPTIRLLQSGTFSDYIQLRLDEGSRNNGQLKVPIVLSKTAYITWFSNRVVHEF